MSTRNGAFTLSVQGSRLCVHGDVDAHTAPRLAAAFSENNHGDLTVDLGDVSFMDTSGVHVLMLEAATRRAQGSRLVVAETTRQIRRLFALSRVDDIIHVTPSDA